MARDVQIKIVAFDQASGAFKQIATASERMTQQMLNINQSSSGAVYNSAGIAAGIVAYNALTSAAQGALNMTLNFSKTMETNEIGIAGILMSMTTLNGESLKWGDAINISKDTMRQLNDEALKTAATSEEMVNTYRGLLGPGLAAKMTMQEIVQLTSTGVNAVKSLGLNNTQLVQELRDLVQGGIQASSSTLATALGLKDKDIKAAKESSEGLFKFLMDRLEGFKVASEYTQNTFSGKIDQIKEGITRIGSVGTLPIFDAIKDNLDVVGKKLITINSEAKNIEINPELENGLTNISTKVVKLGSDLQELFLPITDVAVPALKIAGTALSFVADNVVAVGRGLATWYVLTTAAGIYSNIAAAAGGATVANGFLGNAVLRVAGTYQIKQAAAENAAIIEMAAYNAALAGASRVSNAILYCIDEYIALGVSAETAGAMQTKAAMAAASGNFKLAESILVTNMAYARSAEVAEAASIAAIRGSANATTAVASFGKTVLALAGGWLGVGMAAAWATSMALDYFKNQGRIESYNKKAEVRYIEENGVGKNQKRVWDPNGNKVSDGLGGEVSNGGAYVWQDLTPEENQKHYEYVQQKEDFENGITPKQPTPPDFSNLGLKFQPPEEVDKKAGKKAEQAYEEAQRLKDKIADMMAKMNEKITEETSSVFDLSSMKLKDELANMQRDLDKSAIDFGKYGIETKAVRDKMVEYEKVATDKINKVWNESWSNLWRNNSLMGAQILSDKQAQAEAEYQIELEKIRKEKEARSKEVGRTGDGYENVQAKIDEEANQKTALAVISRNKKIRDDKLQQYDLDVQHNNMLVQLEGKTYVEIDALNKQALQSKITALDAEITAATTTKEDRIKLEQEKVAAIESLQQISGRNMVTAASETIRQIKAQQHDYASDMVQTWNDVNSKTSDHFKNMVKGVEGLGDGIKGTIKDISASISDMFIQMAYQQMIFQPLQNWFSGILGSFGGSAVTGSGTAPVGVQGPSMIDGSFYKKRAKGGMTSGLTLVGEEGPELINFTNPGMVYTAGQTKNILNNANQSQSQNQRQSQRPVMVNVNVSTPDVGSFRQSRGQVGSVAARGMQRAFRRNG